MYCLKSAQLTIVIFVFRTVIIVDIRHIALLRSFVVWLVVLLLLLDLPFLLDRSFRRQIEIFLRKNAAQRFRRHVVSLAQNWTCQREE